MQTNRKKRANPNVVILLLLAAVASLAVFFIFFYPSYRIGLRSVPPEEELEPVGGTIRIDFNYAGALRDWHDYAFSRKSVYRIEPDETGALALRATSRDAYSSIFKVINVPIESRPILSWQWRAVKFPTGKKNTDLGAEGENDFAIRVCVVFTKNNPFASDIIQYVWDDRFPEETYAKSPYKKNVRIIVARSGVPKPGEWFTETRNVYEDYQRVFGRPPQDNLRAVSVITNSDDTKSESEAFVRYIEISKSKVVVPVEKKSFFDIGRRMRETGETSRRFFGAIFRPLKHVPGPWKNGNTNDSGQIPSQQSIEDS